MPVFNSAVALVLLLVCAAPAAESRWSPEDFVIVSGAASPRVAFALQRTDAGLQLAITAASLAADGLDTSISVGLAAEKKIVLTNKDAQSGVMNGCAQYEFSVPAAALAAQDAGWELFRMAFAVSWSGGALGQDRQRERFRHRDCAAPHTGLSPSEADWLPLNLVEHALAVADRKNRIQIAFEQPQDGKATLVVADEQGNRLRNLAAGQPFAKGAQKLEWDGLDERGNVVKPGAYRWRAVHHPGIKPQYLMSYGNGDNEEKDLGGWGPNHVILVAAAAGPEWTFFAAPFTEGGDAIIAVNQQGVKQKGYNPPMGTGLAKVALAIEGEVLYVANDGLAWGQHLDTSKPGAKTEQKIALSRFDVKTGNLLEFKGKGRFITLFSVEVGPGAADKEVNRPSLEGLAALHGKLYLANRRTQSVWVLDPNTGVKIDEIKLDSPGPLAATATALLAVSDTHVVKVAPASHEVKTVVSKAAASPRGLAVDAAGNLYVSDGATHTVKVFDPGGKPVRELGKPGGEYKGSYDPERMVNPA
ncbi:MAG: FlgD immunoglobulin-like domain containing protein, partial [Planctomycetota bacterium]